MAALAVVVPFFTSSPTYTILTPSMAPAYPPGTLIVLRPVEPEELRVGDVITFQVSSGNDTGITHRIIGVTESSNGGRTFTTMGDNNAKADDASVRPEQIRGVVWYAIPWIGVISTLRSQGVLGLMITAAGGVLLAIGTYYVIAGVVQRLRRP